MPKRCIYVRILKRERKVYLHASVRRGRNGQHNESEVSAQTDGRTIISGNACLIRENKE